MSMTHGSGGRSDEQSAPRPPTAGSAHSSHSSGSGSSKHVKCIGRYVLTGSTLGKGNFARVEAAVHTLTRAKVAVKIIETDKIKEDYVRKNLLREAQLMRRLKHPNIIRLYETMKTNNLYCLVTEIAEGGELLSHVRNDFKEKRLSEATARPFIRQLVSALHHLHSMGIVHRDLKMENILLDKKKRNVKIVDFGLSNAQKPGSLLQTHCGSPEYAAPELFIPGREYGPEVDVWSLGVNMYAMLVGKLPFRSPRQGTKRRQKLLEQITGGLVESHEKEMVHVSRGARDLIGRLLQPDPRRRIFLDEAMIHPWITKEGAQILMPYKYTPPDAVTQHTVMELMSTVLEVRQTDIRETVRRDRCDWLAAIYNLLLDQPEGRMVLHQLLSNDPEDQLVDAAHYQGSMEYLHLSQGDALDQPPPEVANALTSSTAQGSAPRKSSTPYRHSLSQADAPSDYDSATLPVTRKERKRHHSQEMRPLGVPRTPLNPVQPPPYLRRASIASPQVSPDHQPMPDPLVQSRRLPATPHEEPYQRPHDVPPRPHSRAESTPDPLPVPWRQKFAPRKQLIQSPRSSQVRSPNASPPPASRPKSPLRYSEEPPSFREPVISPLMKLHPTSKKNALHPIRPRSISLSSRKMSGSIDTQLHVRSSHPHAANPTGWPRNRTQVTPGGRRSSIDSTSPPIGWAGTQVTSSKRVGSLGWMKNLPSSPYASILDVHETQKTVQSGSVTSMDLKLFTPPTDNQHMPNGPSPHASRILVKSDQSLRAEPISGMELPQKRHSHHRSSSARPNRPHSMYVKSPALTASVNHMADVHYRNGPTYINHGTLEHGGYEMDLPNIEEHSVSLKASAPNGRKTSFPFFGKLRGRSSKERTNHHPHTSDL